MWRKQAENLANWAKKGALIGITGRIQTRTYDNQQGQRVYVTEVVAENFQLMEFKKDGSQPTVDNHERQVPNFARNSNPMDISDDDCRFDI